VENKILSRSYFIIKNSGNGVSFNQNIVESRSTMLFNQDQFFSTFYLNKWDLNNSYLDNQQIEANSKSSEPLHKKSMGSCF
jgi:hypothetical protein